MPRVLILCAHRPGRSPSQRYRFEQYLPFLEQHGFEFDFSYLLSETDDRLFYSPGKFLQKVWILFKSIFIRIKDWSRFGNYDIIFIQREALFLGTSFFEKRAARSGAYVIFDFDDSIWIADTSPGNQKWEWIKKPEKLFNTLGYVQQVIAGNDYLANKAMAYNKTTRVIPTTIDTAIHFPMPELRHKNPLVLGWSGSISTIKHFETLVPVLQQLNRKYPGAFIVRVMGDPAYRNTLLPLESVAWSADTEVQVLNTFDIGLMPLPDDAWANGKCGLKGLSYMACAVPTVMSAVGVNKHIIQHGENGFLAKDDQEWFDLLSSLIEDAALRKRIGENGRLTVETSYSVQSHQASYLEVFRHVGR